MFQGFFRKTQEFKRGFQMNNRKTLGAEHISTAKEKLLALSSTVKAQSATKTIQALKTEIRTARRAGRSWKEIAQVLKEAGVEVSQTLLATECKIKPKGKKNAEFQQTKKTLQNKNSELSNNSTGVSQIQKTSDESKGRNIVIEDDPNL